MKREVIVALTRAPYGRIHVPEGVRAATGVAAGFDRHDVTVLFTADGVYAARAAVDRDGLGLTEHVTGLTEQGGRMIADAVAMDERGIDQDEIAPDVTVRSADHVGELFRETDHVLTF